MSLRFDDCAPSEGDFNALFATTGWNDEYHLTASELISAVRASWKTIAVYDDRKLVGFGRVVSDGILHAMIYDLIVDPAYQGQGIGGRVLERLIEECGRAHIRDIQLFCARGKRAFYERRGFRARPDDAPGMEYVVASGSSG